MGFSFDIDLNEREFNKFFQKDFPDAVTKGTKAGLNRAATSARTTATREIKSKYPLHKAGNTTWMQRIRNDIQKPEKATGNVISAMEAILPVESRRAVQAIRAVHPAGRTLGASPSLKVTKGNKIKSKGRFIQSGRGNNLLLFRNPRRGVRKKIRSGGRTNNSEYKIIGQRLKRVALMLQDRDVYQRFEIITAIDLVRQINQAVGWQIDRIK